VLGRVLDADWLGRLREGQDAVWLSPIVAAKVGEAVFTRDDIDEAAARLKRFEPLLARLFPQSGWDGRIRSSLLSYVEPPVPLTRLLIKGDHALPMTGSIKARGGVHDLLAFVERIALQEGLIKTGESYVKLAEPAALETLSLHSVAVASTGNLGFSVGLVGRRLGLNAEIHMSSDAKEWKKDRLRALGAKVAEHDCDYTETVARARVASAGARRTHFVDDETSRELFTGYAAAAQELNDQLMEAGLTPTPERPLVVYLPCGVGGAPGGVLFGLKAILGEAVVGVFVEPVASACFLAAMGTGEVVSVYDLGLNNATQADGLAVPRASSLVVEAVGPMLDAVVAVPDAWMLDWARHAHHHNGLRLELSAAAGLAAVEPFMKAVRARDQAAYSRLLDGVHVVWTTGGSLLPDAEFAHVLEG